MGEIVFHKVLATAPSLALAASALPDWAGPLLVIVLGLGLLALAPWQRRAAALVTS